MIGWSGVSCTRREPNYRASVPKGLAPTMGAFFFSGSRAAELNQSAIRGRIQDISRIRVWIRRAAGGSGGLGVDLRDVREGTAGQDDAEGPGGSFPGHDARMEKDVEMDQSPLSLG